jgi:hypothetical protein
MLRAEWGLWTRALWRRARHSASPEWVIFQPAAKIILSGDPRETVFME